MNTTTAEEMARWLFEDVFNQRDLAICDDLFAPRFVEHAMAPFGTEAPGSVDGPIHMRGVVNWLVDQFPDLRMNIEAIVADDMTVAVRVRSTGTNLGKLNGFIPPTGKTFNAEQSHWYRIENGQFVEHWAVRDDLTSMIQLGALPRPGQPAT
jgi:predicted ester cyclase